jgi:hypothetical protein
MAAAPPPRRRRAPRRAASPLLALALAAAAAAALTRGAAAQLPDTEWDAVGAFDPDSIWNDMFGKGSWVWRPVVTQGPSGPVAANRTAPDWTEAPHWVAPGQAPQMQWWNSRAREGPGARRAGGWACAAWQQHPSFAAAFARCCRRPHLPHLPPSSCPARSKRGRRRPAHAAGGMRAAV